MAVFVVIQQIRHLFIHDVLFLPQKYRRFPVQPKYSAGSILSRALEWKVQGYLPFRENLAQIPAGLAHALWALMQRQHGIQRCGVCTWPRPSVITPGRQAQVSLERLSITVLVTLRQSASSNLLPKLLFWDLSYINMQPHILHTCVNVCLRPHTHTHTSTHKHMHTDYLGCLYRTSDKAYLIREHSSLNQV